MKKIPEELKEIVLWQLDTEMPDNFKLCIGNEGSFTKAELREHIEKESKIGVTFARMQMRFIRDLLNGKITKALLEGNE